MQKSIASKKLDSYVRRVCNAGFRRKDVAARLGVERSALYTFTTGRKLPGLRTAFRIEKICKIKCQEWFK